MIYIYQQQNLLAGGPQIASLLSCVFREKETLALDTSHYPIGSTLMGVGAGAILHATPTPNPHTGSTQADPTHGMGETSQTHPNGMSQTSQTQTHGAGATSRQQTQPRPTDPDRSLLCLQTSANHRQSRTSPRGSLGEAQLLPGFGPVTRRATSSTLYCCMCWAELVVNVYI